MKIKPAEKEELKREDDILLQATGFLQSGFFIYTVFFQKTIDIDFVKALIVFTGVIFYILRALAKLKDNNKLRYLSVLIFFELVLTDLAIVMWMIKPNFMVGYIFSIIVVFISSFTISALKDRYPKTQGAQHSQEIQKQKEVIKETERKNHPTTYKSEKNKRRVRRIVFGSLILGIVFLLLSLMIFFIVILPLPVVSPIPTYSEDPYGFLFFTSEDIEQNNSSSIMYVFNPILPETGEIQVRVIAEFFCPMYEVNDENSTYFVLQTFQSVSNIDVIVNSQSPNSYGGTAKLLSYPKEATSYILIEIPNQTFITGSRILIDLNFTWEGIFWRNSFYEYNTMIFFNSGYPNFINDVGLPEKAINGNGLLLPDITKGASIQIAKTSGITISEVMPNPDNIGFAEGKTWYSWDLKKRSDRDRYASTGVSIQLEVENLKRTYEFAWAAFPLALGIGLPLMVSSSIEYVKLNDKSNNEANQNNGREE
jgi:hypothetical protein